VGGSAPVAVRLLLSLFFLKLHSKVVGYICLRFTDCNGELLFALFFILTAYSNSAGKNRLLVDDVMNPSIYVIGRRLSCARFTFCECTPLNVHEKMLQL